MVFVYEWYQEASVLFQLVQARISGRSGSIPRASPIPESPIHQSGRCKILEKSRSCQILMVLICIPSFPRYYNNQLFLHTWKQIDIFFSSSSFEKIFLFTDLCYVNWQISYLYLCVEGCSDACRFLSEVTMTRVTVTCQCHASRDHQS